MVKEAILYAPICDGAFQDGFLLFKIEDGGRMKKPFDIVGIDPNGDAVAIEVKVYHAKIDRDKALPGYLFEWQQQGWLSDWGKRGGLSLVALYQEDTAELHVFRLQGPQDWESPMSTLHHSTFRRQGGVFRGWQLLLTQCQDKP